MDKSSVRHPSHYQSDGVECIAAMYAISPTMAINFSVGSALKYLDRAGRKGDEDTDLRKAKECWHMAKRLMVRKVAEDGKADSLESIADELEELSESNRINGNGEVFYRAGDLAERIRKLAKEEER